MNRETLMHFCATDERPVLEQPWTRDGYTYATNGRILLRVPAVEGIEYNPAAPNIGPPTFMWEHETTPDEWQDAPEVKPQSTPCEKCGGKGRVKVCPKCKNLRTVFCVCSECYNEHETPCPVCTAGDTIQAWLTPENVCMICQGTGSIDKITSFKLKNGALASDKYLGMLSAHLQNVQLAGGSDPMAALLVRFDGGLGYLMPLRDPTNN